MGLNIKNERVHQLAREAARRMGRSQTSVIEEALTRLLADLPADQTPPNRLARIDEIVADFDSRLSDAARAGLDTEDLYDGRGLPA
jgi:antitoxin VapB